MTDSAGWFGEPPIRGFQQRFLVRRNLYAASSAYQRIEVVETELLGRTLVLDGAVQTTERDEFIYHEMLALVPLMAHPNPARVLIIGGGDGGTMRRVLADPRVRSAVLVEIDPQVVGVCRQYLPEIAGRAFDDPRAQLVIADGVRFVADTAETYDVILVDSTDPVGPAAGLFTVEFFQRARSRLRSPGIFVTQSGSPILMTPEFVGAYRNLGRVFRLVRPYFAPIPAYPGVWWSFLAASDDLDPAMPIVSPAGKTGYYTPEVHRAAFALPPFLKAVLSGGHVDALAGYAEVSG